MEYDYRTKQQGVWKQKDNMLSRDILEEKKTYNSSLNYR